MSNKFKMDNPGKRIMLENEDGTYRYEFFTRAVSKSNLDDTIAYYVPVVRCCQRFFNGSTYHDRDVCVEEGNATFKNLLSKGYKIVTEKSFS